MAKKSLWNEVKKWHWKMWRQLEKTLGMSSADVIIDLAMLAFFAVLMSTFLSDIAAKQSVIQKEHSQVHS